MTDWLENLNPEQKKAVTHQDGPLLIIAGAGTGKTTVVTSRIAWLILNKLAKPDEVLAMTFTDKAAGEMEERVDQLLPYGYVDLWVSTFHAFCERILKDHAIDIGLPPDFKLLNETSQWLLVRKNLERFNLDYYRPLGNPTKFIRALLKHFSRAKDEAVRPEQYLGYVKGLQLDTDSPHLNPLPFGERRTKKEHPLPMGRGEGEGVDIQRLEEIADAYHVYQQLLLENSALDFGDLINYTLELFQKRPHILNKYRQQFKYILVDEFQDTNWAQYELIKLLAAPKNNLTVVGDDDQSVYKFRGASVSNILQFKKDYPEASEVVIAKNYRNKQEILDAAYQFIQQNNPYRLEYQLKSNKLNKKLEAQNAGKGFLKEIIADNYLQEVELVAKEILSLQKKNKDANWRDYTILTRANDYVLPFIKIFSSYGLPYVFLASRGLYSKPIILDIIAYLKLLDNYHENPALYRVLNLPILNLPAERIIQINHFAARKSISLFEAIRKAAMIPELGAETVSELNKLLGLISKHTALTKTESVGKIILAFLEDSGYLKYLTTLDTQEGHAAIEYLNQLYKKVQVFETDNPEPTVKNFLEILQLEIEAGEGGSLNNDSEQGPEAIRIMTVHSAKGLEFRYVFIVNLVDKRFPSTERLDPIELPTALIKEILPEGDVHLQEERRLFYVALTRAKDGVYLTRALDYGGARQKKPSRFLYELGLVKEELKSAKKSKKTRKETLVPELPKIIAPAALHSLPLPKYFSYTQYRAFKSCPFQYKLAHIFKIPVKGKAQFSFGQTLHRTLYDFYHLIQEGTNKKQADLFGGSIKEQTVVPSLDTLLKIYQERWVDDWYESAAQKKNYFKRGETALKNFYEVNKDNLRAPLYLEQGFFLKLKNGTIKGAIDRVDSWPDGSIEIIDYKTGEGKTEETLDAEAKEQLVIYQIAAQEVLHQKPAQLTFYYLENGQKLSFLGSAEDMKKVKQKFECTIEEIKISKFEADPAQHKCRNCDFKDICEFRIL